MCYICFGNVERGDNYPGTLKKAWDDLILDSFTSVKDGHFCFLSLLLHQSSLEFVIQNTGVHQIPYLWFYTLNFYP